MNTSEPSNGGKWWGIKKKYRRLIIASIIWILCIWCYTSLVSILADTSNWQSFIWVNWITIVCGLVFGARRLKRWRTEHPSAHIRYSVGILCLVTVVVMLVIGFFRWRDDGNTIMGDSIMVLLIPICFFGKNKNTNTDTVPEVKNVIKTHSNGLIIMVLIGIIICGWPYQEVKAQQVQVKPNVLQEICIGVILGTLAIIGGCKLHTAFCKLQKKINKQQQDPDEPPPTTNAPPNKPPPPSKQSSIAGETLTLSSRMDELTLITNSFVLTNGFTTTDISKQSSTNMALWDNTTTNQYILWTRFAVFQSSDPANLPSTNNAGLWMKNVTNCAIRMRVWATYFNNNPGNQMLSQLTVVDGSLVVPYTNYWQCEYPSNWNYVNPTNLDSMSDQVIPLAHPLDKSIMSRYFELSPADTQ